MNNSPNKVLLNDLLQFEDLDNVKIRFNLMFRDNWNPIEIFNDGDLETLLEGHYWNFRRKRSFKEGQITVGLLRINKNEHSWLLFHVGKVTKDLGVFDGVGYEYDVLPEYQQYFGRLIIRYENKSQNMIRLATSVINDCEIVPPSLDAFGKDIFPGHDKVNIT